MSIKSDAEEGLYEALEQAGNRVLDQAERDMPVGDPRLDPDPGTALRRAGRVVRDGKGVIVVIDTPYAAKQHEDMTLDHPRGGGPKFLENAVTRIIPELEGIVASKVRARTATGLSGTASRSHHRGR